jgi:hypothetical protein
MVKEVVIKLTFNIVNIMSFDEQTKHNIQQHILTLFHLGFITLTSRQNQMLEAFTQKYQKMGLPHKVYRELVKDAKILILFS